MSAARMTPGMSQTAHDGEGGNATASKITATSAMAPVISAMPAAPAQPVPT